MYKDQIRQLEHQHQQLDNQIDTLEKTGIYEDIRMQDLKKRRLSIRDQLSDLRRKQWVHDHETVNFQDYE